MKELLEIGLLIGGWSLVILCIGSFWIPKVLGWREKLAGLTPLMRELWWTYSAYVWGSHVLFAVLALGFGDWLRRLADGRHRRGDGDVHFHAAVVVGAAVAAVLRVRLR